MHTVYRFVLKEYQKVLQYNGERLIYVTIEP